jgi:hypothetical protein
VRFANSVAPIIALFTLGREGYRLFYVGVGKVTGRPYGRRKTDRRMNNDAEE